MTLRDLSPWLIPSIVVLATAGGVPRATSTRVAEQIIAQGAATNTKQEASPAASPSSSEVDKSSQDRLDCYDHDARHLLWDFANASELSTSGKKEVHLKIAGSDTSGKLAFDENITAEKSSDSGCDPGLTDEKLQGALRGFTLSSVIVTLPDPIASHLQNDFDTAMEAIQAAAADAGYSLDRFDLPWVSSDSDAAGSNAKRTKRDPAVQPGLILFRGQSALLLIYLVGETPTSGVQKRAMFSALQQTAELSSIIPVRGDMQPRPDSKFIRVGLLAPFFTGSAASLRLVLRAYPQWAKSHKGVEPERKGADVASLHVTIISGSAEGVEQDAFVGEPFDNSKKHEDKVEFEEPVFKATQGYVREIQSAFLRFLRNTVGVGEDEKVAVLRESNTAFGASLADMTTFPEYLSSLGDQGDPGARDLLQLIAQPSPHLEQYQLQELNNYLARYRKYLDEVSYVDLPFPLHVSAIRNSAPSTQMPLDMPTALQGSKTFFPVLLPNARSGDLIPPFAEQMDKAEAELVMSNLLATLNDEEIHYAGIVATDIRDAIYLSREIHDNCPDTMVFCLSSNLLALNPDVSRDLSGTIVVSTYPLFTDNQNMTYPWNRDSHREFSSQSAEGVFNAALALLGRPDRMLDYGFPFAEIARGDAGEHHPPIWVEAVGNTSLVPIDILGEGSPTLDNYFFEPTNPQSKRFDANVTLTLSWTTTVLFWGATAFCAWTAVLVMAPWLPRAMRPTWRPDPWHSSIRRNATFSALLLALLLSYLTVSGLVLVPALSGLLSHRYPGRLRIWASHLVLLLLLMSVVAQLLMMIVSRVTDEGDNVTRALRLSAPIFIAFPFSYAILSSVFSFVANRLGALGDFRETFASLRYSLPGEGFSPFPPLFFASLAILIWALSALRRASMLEAMCGEGADANPVFLDFTSTSQNGASHSLSDVADREKEIEKRIRSAVSVLLPRMTILALLIAGFAYCFLVISGSVSGPRDALRLTEAQVIASLEGKDFDALFAGLFFLAYLGSFFNFLRFVTVWTEFRRLLRRLSWHPLREGCAELGRPSSTSSDAEESAQTSSIRAPQLSFASSLPTFTALEFSAELGMNVVRETLRLRPALHLQLKAQLLGRIADAAQIHPTFGDKVNEAWRSLSEGLAADAKNDFTKRHQERIKAQRALATASSILTKTIDPDWPLPETGPIVPDVVEGNWSRAAVLFLASRILDYSRHVLAQLRNLLALSTLGALLMLIAVSSYPFPRSDTILRFGWISLLAMVVIGLVIYVQMNRDRILSLLSGGTPGKIDWDSAFVGHFALYGLLPVLTILGIRFPATFSGIVNSVGSLLPGGHP